MRRIASDDVSASGCCSRVADRLADNEPPPKSLARRWPRTKSATSARPRLTTAFSEKVLIWDDVTASSALAVTATSTKETPNTSMYSFGRFAGRVVEDEYVALAATIAFMKDRRSPLGR